MITVFVSIFLTACGGGGEDDFIIQSRSAWDNALVFKPYDPVPIKIKDLGKIGPHPVAISLHGCSGVDDFKLSLGERYYPILMAMQGYLVIQPNSYYGMVPNTPTSFLCYQDAAGKWILNGQGMPDRIIDAEFAIDKVKNSDFWDKKTLLVQGHSQGFLTATRLTASKTLPVTKWLLTGLGGCSTYSFTNKASTMIVNSRHNYDDYVPQECVNLAEKTWPNIKFYFINSADHNVLNEDEGYLLMKEFIKIK
jgi:dienelactone hydrolase